MKHNVFKNKSVENAFDEDGIIVIKSFLNAEEIDKLLEYYKEEHEKEPLTYSFYASTFSKNPEYRYRVFEKLYHVFKRSLDDTFMDYKPLGASMLIKKADPHSELQLHQDMTLLDEENFTSVSVWVCLCDVSEEQKNGVMYMLPGSHNFYRSYRFPTIPYPYQDFQDKVLTYLKPVNVKKGDAVIFNQSVIHYSPPNFSGMVRVAVDTFLTHKDASVYTVYKPADSDTNQLDLYLQDDDFLMKYPNFRENVFERPPIGVKVKEVHQDVIKTTPDEFGEMVKKYSTGSPCKVFEAHSFEPVNGYFDVLKTSPLQSIWRRLSKRFLNV